MLNLRGEPGSAPRIVPERIREAREATGLTAEQFAELLGVSRQAVGQYEVGHATPSPQVMSRIIATTKQPPNFFTAARARTHEPFGTPFWRGLKRMQRTDRLRIARRLEWAWDVVAYLEQFLELPPVNLPPLDWDYETGDEESLEEIAGTLRAFWKLGDAPVHHLVALLETNGIIVIREHVQCDDMDAVSRWQAGRPFILVSADKDSGPRNAFDLAHELGHILLHNSVETNKENIATLERQANYFAGAFLLPRKAFSREIVSTSIDYFTMLKERWRVSIQAMVYRCKELEILNENQVGYLWRQMNAQGIRRREPLDDVIRPEIPTLLGSALKMLFDHGVQSRQQVCDAVSINPAFLESLCAVAPGFLDQTVVPLRGIKPKFS